MELIPFRLLIKPRPQKGIRMMMGEKRKVFGKPSGTEWSARLGVKSLL